MNKRVDVDLILNNIKIDLCSKIVSVNFNNKNKSIDDLINKLKLYVQNNLKIDDLLNIIDLLFKINKIKDNYLLIDYIDYLITIYLRFNSEKRLIDKLNKIIYDNI